MSALPSPVVVKLGGSYALSAHLRHWLAALASCAGRVVIVPGGGPLADAVRDLQPRMGFDDRAAHAMAMLAMAQYACALASLDEAFVVVASAMGVRRAVRAGRVPVWSPVPMALRSRELPASWDTTSDSIAAWLAGRIAARRILFVKQVLPGGDPVRIESLVADGTLDPVLPDVLGAGNIEAYIAGPADHAAVGAALLSGTKAGIRIILR